MMPIPKLNKLAVNRIVFMRGQIKAIQFSNATESYTERQAKKGRPVSPHVTIYKFPITAISSITNRATGVALTVGMAGIGGLSLIGADVPSIMTAVGSSSIGPLAKFSVGFPLIYHYLGAIRHMVWDKIPDSTLTNESVEQSSYLLFGAASGLSVIISFLSF